MKFYSLIFCILAVVLIQTGCATMPNPELGNKYVAEAQDLEKNGDLPTALEKYKLALTADPGNATAKESRQRLTDKLAQMADERYNLGMKYHRQGKYGLARKEFLKALTFQPDHPEASQMLVSRQPEKAPEYVFHVVKPGQSLSKIAGEYYGDVKKFDIIAKYNNIKDATLVKPGQRIMIPMIEGIPLKKGTLVSQDEKASYVEHTLRPGESISKLAKMYYGDYKQFHIIAQYNNMDDATRVTVGQKIKIPKIAGLPFKELKPVIQEKKPQKEEPVEKMAEPVEQEAVELETVEETETPTLIEEESADDEQIIAYRDSGIDLFNEGKFEDAIFELNKAIEAAPGDKETRTFLARAYLESGKQLFDQNDFNASKEAFESSLQYEPNCDQCHAYIEQCQLGPILLQRKKGIEYFGKNQYDQAIAELERFLAKKPNDNEARTYISKAYFQKALGAYTKGDFESAQKGFEAALAYDETCSQCQSYISQSIESYKESHYNKGIVYFGKEQLAEAISEWESVYKIDPQYKDVDQNLKKARLLMEKLEKIKQSSH